MENFYSGVINQYRKYINMDANVKPITLHEGRTPLIALPRLSRFFGKQTQVWVKYEGLNPTGSFKDRGMTTAISDAAHKGAKTVICASTGNTAASAAAYAAKAGMRSIVIIPAGKVAAGKLAGAVAYGAEVIQIDGSFDDALKMVVKISEKHPIALVNSLNPFRLEGQKTAAFEICDDLGHAPDWLVLPVGNAGNITAYWMGFKQYHKENQLGLPAILAVQAEGSAPLLAGHPIEKPETVATAIRIGNPARGEEALFAVSQSRGLLLAVSDLEILSSQKILASEGVWVEPASAAGLAGMIKQNQHYDGFFNGKKIVIICTGHGLKDPDIVIQSFKVENIIKPDLSILEELIIANQ